MKKSRPSGITPSDSQIVMYNANAARMTLSGSKTVAKKN